MFHGETFVIPLGTFTYLVFKKRNKKQSMHFQYHRQGGARGAFSPYVLRDVAHIALCRNIA